MALRIASVCILLTSLQLPALDIKTDNSLFDSPITLAAINKDETSTLPRPITSQYYLDHLAQQDEILVQVTEEDFDQALAELIPSVSAQELEHYQQVQKMFNSDDFAKNMEAAAAEEQRQKELDEEQEQRELEEALRKVEEAQRQLTADEQQQQQQVHQQDEHGAISTSSSGSKGKGKGRSAEYGSSEEQHLLQREEPQLPVSNPIELEEPVMVSEQDQEAIREALNQKDTKEPSNKTGKSTGSGGGGGKNRGKSKGRK
jgi:multidrug efflux pump subunit AcrA (membrane-fusion protein)